MYKNCNLALCTDKQVGDRIIYPPVMTCCYELRVNRGFACDSLRQAKHKGEIVVHAMGKLTH